MSNYYQNKLSAERLQKCYEIAPVRVKQYLDAEISHVLENIGPRDVVLELGCGYGRVLLALSPKAKKVIGIDISQPSLQMARRLLKKFTNCQLLNMNALQLTFGNQSFDKVICIQNGISAFHVNQRALIKESIRVTKQGGMVIFSTYSEKFWEHRLKWFHLQAEQDLIGEIDDEKTSGGRIVCKDGFTATMVSVEQFLELTAGLKAKVQIIEVDKSSLFCEITL
jgi:ubiquinone/menaquinone biosynthesis C-methylase UbiE